MRGAGVRSVHAEPLGPARLPRLRGLPGRHHGTPQTPTLTPAVVPAHCTCCTCHGAMSPTLCPVNVGRFTSRHPFGGLKLSQGPSQCSFERGGRGVRADDGEGVVEVVAEPAVRPQLLQHPAFGATRARRAEAVGAGLAGREQDGGGGDGRLESLLCQPSQLQQGTRKTRTRKLSPRDRKSKGKGSDVRDGLLKSGCYGC